MTITGQDWLNPGLSQRRERYVPFNLQITRLKVLMLPVSFLCTLQECYQSAAALVTGISGNLRCENFRSNTSGLAPPFLKGPSVKCRCHRERLATKCFTLLRLNESDLACSKAFIMNILGRGRRILPILRISF